MSTSIVPIINIAPFLKADATHEEKLAVAREIGKACEEVGFFIIVGHGIPEGVIENAWKSTREFFDQPIEVKAQYITKDEKTYPFGYSPIGGEVLSSGKQAEKEGHYSAAGQAPDIKEMFSLGPADPNSGFPTRIFPSTPTSFEYAYTAYYAALNNLARKILQAFTMTLSLDIDFFEQFIDHHASALRALNYPEIAINDKVLPGQCRASAHTDYGTITILRADGPGLQVSKDKDPPVWHDVPYVENAFIINLGDLMKRWTNDQWLSTLHRVIIPSSDVNSSGVLCRRRQSMAFFHNLNRDAVVSVILRKPEDKPKYEPIVAGDFLLQKHLASMGAAANKK